LFEIKDTTTLDTKEQKIEKAYRLKNDLLLLKFKGQLQKKFYWKVLILRQIVGIPYLRPIPTGLYMRITDNSITRLDT